ncbi:MAG: alpha/beta hydrolase [Parasporobacterium sp.]|nr:alpha/beta hydrolase [Parasporobacterium sp.]
MIIKQDFWYPAAQEARRLHIYLPDNYHDTDERYPVMYYFDGHNLFFDEDATFGTSWGLNEFMHEWNKQLIIVGMECSHHGNDRLTEYSPYQARYGMFSDEPKGDITFDWIINDIKPVIDREFRTYADRSCTGIAGSSMGGLMAFYGVVHYNNVFSKAACISSAFGFCMPQVHREINEHPVDPDTRVYLSWGTREAKGVNDHEHEDTKSYTSRANRSFARKITAQGAAAKVFCQLGGIHSESSWREQNRIYMDFLWNAAD